jgi:hypothetical protein
MSWSPARPRRGPGHPVLYNLSSLLCFLCGFLSYTEKRQMRLPSQLFTAKVIRILQILEELWNDKDLNADSSSYLFEI